jgi:hypothetical protein
LARSSIARERLDLAVEVGDQAQQHLQPPACRLAQLDLLEEGLAGLGAKQLRLPVLEAVAGEQRVHPILERRAHLGQRHPLAEQIAQVAQLARRHIGLGQQIGAQQVGERAGVDGVGLHPRGGDRLGAQRVGKVQLVAVVLEQSASHSQP